MFVFDNVAEFDSHIVESPPVDCRIVRFFKSQTAVSKTIGKAFLQHVPFLKIAVGQFFLFGIVAAVFAVAAVVSVGFGLFQQAVFEIEGVAVFVIWRTHTVSRIKAGNTIDDDCLFEVGRYKTIAAFPFSEGAEFLCRVGQLHAFQQAVGFGAEFGSTQL